MDLLVHRCIKAAKTEEFEKLDLRLLNLSVEKGYHEDLQQTNMLLDYRNHVQQVREWPFSIGGLGILTLYLVIPPLTWVGAALIENLVDTIL